METITLDGKTYQLKDLPEEGQALAQNAGIATKQIRKLEARLAIARTAQNSYVDRLKAIIEKAS